METSGALQNVNHHRRSGPSSRRSCYGEQTQTGLPPWTEGRTTGWPRSPRLCSTHPSRREVKPSRLSNRRAMTSSSTPTQRNQPIRKPGVLVTFRRTAQIQPSLPPFHAQLTAVSRFLPASDIPLFYNCPYRIKYDTLLQALLHLVREVCSCSSMESSRPMAFRSTSAASCWRRCSDSNH